MWWSASSADRGVFPTPPADERPNWTVVDAGWLRLRHGQFGPSAGLRRVDVAGCCLLVIGFCVTPSGELSGIAARVAGGDGSALARVRGSRVVIAVRRDDLLVMGDLAGQHVVFFARTDDGEVVLGSHASELAHHTDRSLDPSWLAARLLVPNASDVWWTGSPWRGVRAVRPGWALRLTREGQATTTCLDSFPQPHGRLRKAGTELRTALTESVRNRVAAASRPTVDLSGGLDSSTVAVLAAGAAMEQVPAITLTADGVEDVEIAAAVARAVPGLAHEQWPIPDAVLPYSGLDAVPVVDEPDSNVATLARSRWWLRLLAEFGSDLHLSGDGGDAVLIALPAYLADLACPRRLPELWRHVAGWARLRHQAPHALVRAASAVRRTSYRAALQAEAKRLRGVAPSASGWARLVAWVEHSRVAEWMTPTARNAVAQRLDEHADAHPSPVVPGELGIGDALSWLSLATFGRAQRLYTDLAATMGVDHHAPYLDDTVVRACWSVAASLRTTPDRAKPLLRYAMGELVPPQLIGRRTKGDYTALVYRGLRENAPMLREVLTRSRLAELGIINDRAIQTAIDRAAAGVPIPLGAFDAVVGTELWLRGQERNRHACLD
ncbi:asparagine synthase [Amycolatopsis rhizosphaerae]|uniref:asparagine synthase (glutamine-hydrolyzing) n=1 Tax=Amycolatopsis rhizosphaerae TaxID=2053003 RepID=A0A558C4W4_9PSEU|nr:albusnodin/ikarugamycin family macrolactam cyclase [Amycolatopsis rhizosphaerae]TVT43831.1 asparagine synthase [Amycolatopsis rhizosphaerae]